MAGVLQAGREMFGQLRDGAGRVLAEANNMANAFQLVGESTSLQVMAQASGKNIVYIAAQDPSVSQIINARSNVLEAGLISCASLVHNFVMTIIYGIAALIQLGQNGGLNSLAKHSILHMGISFACVSVALFGIVSPELAARGTANLINAILTNRAGITAFLA